MNKGMTHYFEPKHEWILGLFINLVNSKEHLETNKHTYTWHVHEQIENSRILALY